VTRLDPVDLPARPGWADPDSTEYDPLLADSWPTLDPPSGMGAERRQWDDTLRLLTAAANALMPARPAFLSTTALAARLGITAGSIRRMVREGKVIALKRGTATQSRLYVPMSEVDLSHPQFRGRAEMEAVPSARCNGYKG
jgi:hypothetical protein